LSIRQGDLFWLDLPDPLGSEPGFPRPCVVVQNDIFNHSRIATVVCCSLSTNLALSSSPGNVLLRKGEANLEKRSVINISQVVTIDRSRLRDKIGTLSEQRISEIVAGLKLLFEPRPLPS
jgi:mRNA interferase MazF